MSKGQACGSWKILIISIEQELIIPRKSNTLEQAALELLSAACINKACREAIERYCSPWLKALAEDRAGTHKALASLVLAKVSSDSSDSDIADKLSALVLSEPDASDQAIEGLAYTSLQPKVKEGIASNAKLVKCLVSSRRTLECGFRLPDDLQ